MIKLKTTQETKRQTQELRKAIKTGDVKTKNEILNKLINQLHELDQK